MACTAASHPDMCPAHTWRGPAESWMSSVMVAAIAFPMILRTVSPIPMGRAPGHLSRCTCNVNHVLLQGDWSREKELRKR